MIERGNPMSTVTPVASQIKDLMGVVHQIHDNWVACIRIWRPPKLTSILRKSSDMQKPIQRVKFTKVIARHTEIRDQRPSLGLICPGEPHQRRHKAPKFEDRSQEETSGKSDGP